MDLSLSQQRTPEKPRNGRDIPTCACVIAVCAACVSVPLQCLSGSIPPLNTVTAVNGAVVVSFVRVQSWYTGPEQRKDCVSKDSTLTHSLLVNHLSGKIACGPNEDERCERDVVRRFAGTALKEDVYLYIRLAAVGKS